MTPGIKETRILLKAQALLDEQGLEDVTCAEAIERFRAEHVERLGVRQYVHQILGDRGNWAASCFILWYDDGAIEPDVRTAIADFLATSSEERGLPDKVSFESGGHPQTYYL